MSRGKETPLGIPHFRTVMGACRFSRLIASQWWKRVLASCTSKSATKMGDLGWLEELVEDLSNSLSGGLPVQKAFSGLIYVTII